MAKGRTRGVASTQPASPDPIPNAKWIADATTAFLDVLEQSGLVWPRDREKVIDDWPQEEMLDRFVQLEFALNPRRFAYDDPKRVGELLAWTREKDDNNEFALPKWEHDPTRLPIAGLTIAIHTIICWWGLEKTTNLTEWSLGPSGSRPSRKVVHLQKNNGWPPAIPRLIVEQMRVAANALASGVIVQWPHPSRNAETVTSATVNAARWKADKVLMTVRTILDDLKRQPEIDPEADQKLLWHFHEMRTAAGSIPSRGWEQCYGSTAFRDFNSSGRCAHLAVRDLDQDITHDFSEAAYEAIHSHWGMNVPCSPIPMIWISEARPLLHWRLLDRGKFDLKYWVDQLAIETSKFPTDISPCPLHCKKDDRSAHLGGKLLATGMDEEVFAYLELLAKSYPDPITFRKIKAKSETLAGANPSRLKDKIPLKIEALIDRSHHGHLLKFPDPD